MSLVSECTLRHLTSTLHGLDGKKLVVSYGRIGGLGMKKRLMLVLSAVLIVVILVSAFVVIQSYKNKPFYFGVTTANNYNSPCIFNPSKSHQLFYQKFTINGFVSLLTGWCFLLLG